MIILDTQKSFLNMRDMFSSPIICSFLLLDYVYKKKSKLKILQIVFFFLLSI